MIDYDAHLWRRHLFDIRGSMLREIFTRVVLCALWATAVVAAHHYLLKHYPEHYGPKLWWLPSSDKGHGLVGVALGLLLVFRTNSSYDRFWEGRKQWGAIVNESRNIARAASVYLAADPELARRLIRWAIAFPWATMHGLRGTKAEFGAFAQALPPEDVKRTLEAQHIPTAVSIRLTEITAEAKRKGLISDYVQMTLDQNAQLLIDYMGACERIHKTPLPFAYVVHLRRALIVYVITLPFALLEPFGWAAIGVTAAIAYIFFGIEEIGVEIEDPFGMDDNDLPLERICTTIERNLEAVANGPIGPRA